MSAAPRFEPGDVVKLNRDYRNVRSPAYRNMGIRWWDGLTASSKPVRLMSPEDVFVIIKDTRGLCAVRNFEGHYANIGRDRLEKVT